jgi:cell division protease FtsH
MKPSKRLLLVVAALLFLAVGVSWLDRLSSPAVGPYVAGEWSYTEFQNHLAKDEVVQARFDPNDHTLYVLAVPPKLPPGTAQMKVVPVSPTIPMPAGLTWKVVLPAAVGVPSQDVLDDLEKHHVDFQVLQPPPPSSNNDGALVLAFLMPFLPTLLIIGFFYWMYRRQNGMPGAGQRLGNLRGLTHKGFRAVNPRDNKTRLADVAGCEEAKTEVAEFVQFLRDPAPYHRVNARMNRGVLMVGPPGTGKTMLAKAIAGEAQVPFYAVSGSEFVEMFVGVGASRVRDLFQIAKQSSNGAIIFIDEIDAMGRSRSTHGSPGNDEREQTLNQLLVEMDGFIEGQNIVVLAATNRADVLDKALLRPGRFDRHIMLPLPDRAARRDILDVHAAKVPLADEVNLDTLARGTVGFSGADLSNLINEAALLAGRHRKSLITRAHLDEALDKIMMGHARAGGIKNVRERKVVAYHEAGHAIVARLTPRTEPVHKITIIPRGQALGLTVQLAEEESFNHDEEMLAATLKVLYGGRAAEQVALKTQTVGASNDFVRGTRLARKMLGSWGMSPELGTVVFQDDELPAHVPSPWSDHWKKELDDRVIQCVTRSYKAAVDLLEEQKDLLEQVAQALLAEETLDAEAFEALVQQYGKAVPDRKAEPPTPTSTTVSLDPI